MFSVVTVGIDAAVRPSIRSMPIQRHRRRTSVTSRQESSNTRSCRARPSDARRRRFLGCGQWALTQSLGAPGPEFRGPVGARLLGVFPRKAPSIDLPRIVDPGEVFVADTRRRRWWSFWSARVETMPTESRLMDSQHFSSSVASSVRHRRRSGCTKEPSTARGRAKERGFGAPCGSKSSQAS